MSAGETLRQIVAEIAADIDNCIRDGYPPNSLTLNEWASRLHEATRIERLSACTGGEVVANWVLVPREPTPEMVACLDFMNPPVGPPEKLTEEYARRWYERRHIALAEHWRSMLAAAPTPPADAGRRGFWRDLQKRCVDWGAYWRAPDAHGVHLSIEQAVELLQDVLGVEVEIKSNDPTEGST